MPLPENTPPNLDLPPVRKIIPFDSRPLENRVKLLESRIEHFEKENSDLRTQLSRMQNDHRVEIISMQRFLKMKEKVIRARQM